jgi:hypothetical protein
VDIDTQAVEVTKLSLLLKVLEGEDEQSIGKQILFQQRVLQSTGKQMFLFQQRVLPDLGNNVKCGNSLIGPDFYDHQQMNLLEDEEIFRVNAFDWQAEFPDIMNDGGFDAVIGNPPYGAFLNKEDKDFVKQNFNSYNYKYDSYIYFIEKAINLSSIKGYISFIVPELWLKIESAVCLRKFIAEHVAFERLHIFGEKVFLNAIFNTMVFVFIKGQEVNDIIVEINGISRKFPTKNWQTNDLLSIDYRLTPESMRIIDKMKNNS